MTRIAYVNGTYLPAAEATVSIFDRGFLFADGVYEVTAVLDGRLIDMAAHFDRLERSLRALDMAWPVTREALHAVHTELVARNDLRSGGVYMQITRGVADRDFAYPADTPTTLVAFTQEKELLDPPAARTGVAVVTMPDIRWQRRDIKSVALLAQAMGKQAAVARGAYEGWMVEDGYVTEGTASNAFIVTADDRVVTRPTSHNILSGVTRAALLRLAEETPVVIEERRFTPAEAYAAKEAFLTSSSSFVMPVVRIDDHPIGNGKPGPVTQTLRRIYIEAARDSAAA